MPAITVITSDKVEIALDTEIVDECITLSNLTESCDDSMEMTIPLPSADEKGNGIDIDSTTINLVVEFIKQNLKTPVVIKYGVDLPVWVVQFCERVGHQMLFNLILAANYLNYLPLVNVITKTFAQDIKGRTLADIRKRYNIVNDSTLEE